MFADEDISCVVQVAYLAKLLGWYGASDMLALPTRQSVRLAHAGDGFSYRKEEGVYGSGRVA